MKIKHSLALLVMSSTTALATVFTNNTVIPVGDLTYEGQPIVVSNCALTVNGPHDFASLLIISNGVVTHFAAPNGEVGNLLSLTITGDLVVDTFSRMDVSGRGYAAQQGPGAGAQNPSGYGSGAGHGGTGGTPTSGGAGGGGYDAVLTPGAWGSGGGHAGGGAGGGLIRLTVAGTLQLDGVIAADGGSPGYPAGAGAGGSLNINAGKLAGSGAFSAQGGGTVNVGGGGGGGGRIALYFATNNFAGTISAAGGAGQQYGGAGTVYSKLAAAAYGLVRVDNAGNAGQWTVLTTPEPFALVVGNQARVSASAAFTNQTLTVATNGLIACVSGQSNFSFTVLGDATVAAGGRIDASGRGYAAQQGPGAGAQNPSGYGSGAGHGGTGGTPTSGGAGGGGYDAVLTPTAWGSGGGTAGGGAGGGLIRLIVAGTLQLDGVIAADGESPNYPAGAGAGGSLNINAGKLAGSGAFSAQGGSTVNVGGGGGGGGRIALYFATNNFAGAISALGGAGQQYGGAGTIYTKSYAGSLGQVLVDNSGNVGAWTSLDTPEAFSMVIASGGKVSALAPLTNSTLLVQSNGVLACPAGANHLSVTVLGNAGIDAGGKVDVNGLGYAPEQGPGAGARDSGGWGSGGGHGGVGGDSYRQQPGGSVYDSLVSPSQWGSGGGSTAGGLGGGAVILNVTGVLRVDGTLTADGLAPTDCCLQHGAGAGGSLWLNAGTLTGGGLIAARGGAGGVTQGGGGGGGGRLALYLTQNTFAGTLSAAGGLGFQNGGAGTVYTKLAADTYGQVLVDNAGNPGLTRLPSSAWPAGLVFDLSLAGAAIVKPDAPQTFHHLRMTNGAVVTHDQAQAGFHWSCLGNAWIASNAAFGVDGSGYLSDTGPGAGSTSIHGYGSGAGHGGAGDVSYNGGISVAPGGGTYGSASEPVTLGSGGGKNGGGAGGPGGAGGGAIRLSIAGTLQLDGIISANGITGEPQRGSGAGGSIWITADTLVGNGSISALGGATSVAGAAGGGGRIALYAYSTAGFNLNHISSAGAAGLGTLVFNYPPPFPTTEVVGSALRLTWRTGSGTNYQVWSTPDLVNWSLFGPLRAGTGGNLMQDCPMTNSPGLFFRVQMGN